MSILYQYLYTIYNFFFFRKGTIDNKKKYDIDDKEHDIIKDDIIKDDIDDKYKQILMKIGDYIVLNEEDINFINTLPNDKLINIIKLYNGSYTETIQCLI